MAQKTIGEQRVRTDFNPANESVVDVIKQGSANMINVCAQIKESAGVFVQALAGKLLATGIKFQVKIK